MGQATVDLPDPLEKSGENAGNAQAQSADDLLSQLAGDEIDRLLAESGDETPVQPASPSTQAKSLETNSSEPASGAVEARKKSALEEEMDLDAAIDAAARERVSIQHDSQLSGKDDSSPQIELGPAMRRLPIFLRPLEWLSAPLDPWPDQFRDLLGKVGLMTLINALAVIAYVMIFRKHH